MTDNVRALDRATFPSDNPFWFGDCLTWVAEDGGELVGFATLDVYPAFGYLTRAGVIESHRRRGLHKRLIDVRVRHARRLGLPRVCTYTVEGNIPSANGLISRGFRFYEPPYDWAGDAWYFQKRLEA